MGPNALGMTATHVGKCQDVWKGCARGEGNPLEERPEERQMEVEPDEEINEVHRQDFESAEMALDVDEQSAGVAQETDEQRIGEEAEAVRQRFWSEAAMRQRCWNPEWNGRGHA